MESIKFNTPEYQIGGAFKNIDYEFRGSEIKGWEIYRDGMLFMKLGSGFVLVKSLYCGVCSTDLARQFFPFPLPQIIGHEVVGLLDNNLVVVEINASHLARNSKWQSCPYCSEGMNSQCPDRITLGIDRLPGGFSPYFLAPVNSIIEVPNSISSLAASVVEPFAAALQGVESSFPCSGDKIAVLGPRRLGTLILSALFGFRKQNRLEFEITAIVRHKELAEICLNMGADTVLNLEEVSEIDLNSRFDIVYDTTGTQDGFKSALNFTRRILHLKSTNGQQTMGLNHLTEMVVDEMAILPFQEKYLDFSWSVDNRRRPNPNVFVSPTVPTQFLERCRKQYSERRFYQSDFEQAAEMIRTKRSFLETSPFPQFDLAIVKSLDEIDYVLRPLSDEPFSIVRARGAVLVIPEKKDTTENELYQAITKRGIQIHSSRCGDFRRALKMMKENPDLVKTIEEDFITQQFPLHEISKAFEIASDSSQSIKVVVETS